MPTAPPPPTPVAPSPQSTNGSPTPRLPSTDRQLIPGAVSQRLIGVLVVKAGQMRPIVRPVSATSFYLNDLCAYLGYHLPQILEFDSALDRYVYDARPIGIQLQITPAWCAARRLQQFGSRMRVALPVLVSGILNADGSQEPKEGFFSFQQAPGSGKIDIYWLHTDASGDGLVFPNAFGDIMIRCQRPAYVQEFSNWKLSRPGRLAVGSEKS